MGATFPPALRSAAILAACLALALPLARPAHAQAASGLAAAPRACGVVESDAARTGYFRDLCRALAVGIHGDSAALEIRSMSAEAAMRALRDGEVPIVIGLPLERRADVEVDMGPAVLIGGDMRYALAHPPGTQPIGDLAAWLFFALVQAEAFGVDRATLATGLEGDRRALFERYQERLTSQLGLRDGAVREMVEAVGNHGEIFARHLGDDPGPNRPVELGGQLYAPPVSER